MTFHIPCLRTLLYLFIIVFPSAYVFFLKEICFSRKSKLLQDNLPVIIVYGMLTAIGLFSALMGNFKLDSSLYWYPLAIIVGAFNISIEYFEAALPVYLKQKKFPNLSPTSVYKEPFSLTGLLSIFFAATLEELVFRQFMISGIFIELGLPIVLMILLSSLFYAINHVYYGTFVVLQKFTSGLVFSIVFVMSGYNIIIASLCHFTQNLLLYLYSVDKKRRRRGGSI